MALDVAVRAPHGGIFVLFAVHNILGYFIALFARRHRRRGGGHHPEVDRRRDPELADAEQPALVNA